MKEELQRIKIAEVCGWRMVEGLLAFPPLEWVRARVPPEVFEKLHCVDYTTIPDYLNDLNDMHEAERQLGEGRFKWDTYCDLLGGSLYHCAHATAAQRAEAFLRTLNLWEE